MSYKVVLASALRKRIAKWQLPDSLLVDVYLRLQSLADKPADQLVRLETPFAGMIYAFALIDPADRMTEYRFLFEVRYGQDEQTLHVIRGGFQRITGL